MVNITFEETLEDCLLDDIPEEEYREDLVHPYIYKATPITPPPELQRRG